jgi:AcrR family transcriptional regulator
MARDKSATRQKLIDAAGRIILRNGFSALGINAVAREAGVDKVLIYRYFGSLDGLLKEYVIQKDFLSHLSELSAAAPPPVDIESFLNVAEHMFISQLRHALGNPEFQQILLWELNESNEITDSLAHKREEAGINMLQFAEEHVDFKKYDIPAAGNLIIGGIYYLVLRARHVDQYSGVDLSSDEGWQRTEDAISLLIKALKEYIRNNK